MIGKAFTKFFTLECILLIPTKFTRVLVWEQSHLDQLIRYFIGNDWGVLLK